MKIQKDGGLMEVEAPGTVLCRKSSGEVPGWKMHGTKGARGWQHYVPASVYAEIKGGKVEGIAFDAEQAAKRKREAAQREHERRMKERQKVGKVWGLARTEAEQAVATGGPKGMGVFGAAREYLFARTVGARRGRVLLERKAGRVVEADEGFEPGFDQGEPLPYCIRSLSRFGYWEEDDAGELHKVGDFPMLIAGAVDTDGKLCGMQRIYLSEDCRGKLVGYEAKKMVGDFCAGAAVRIGSKAEFENPRVVLVCEGVETGWALRLATGLPILCVVSTAGMINIALPALWTDSQLGKLERVIFAKDHDRIPLNSTDRPGDAAARSGAVKLRAEFPKLMVEVVGPDAKSAPGLIADDERILMGEKDGREGKSVDWLDVYVGFGASAVCRGLGIEGVEHAEAEREDGSFEIHGCGADGRDGRAGGDSVGFAAAGGGGRGFGAARGVGGSGGTLESADEGGGLGVGTGNAERSVGTRREARAGEGISRAEVAGDRGGAGAGHHDGDEGGFGESGERKGDAGNGGTTIHNKETGSREIPPILPRGHLAQGREFLRFNAALSVVSAERANQRWELAYLPAGKQWYEYRGTHWETLPEEVVTARVLDHYEPYVILKKFEDGDRTFVDTDGMARAYKRAAITAGNAKSVADAMIGDCAVHTETLPAWSAPTFDGSGRPLFGAGLRKPAESMGAKVIPVKNGLLRIDALVEGRVVLEPHSPRYLSLTCAPFDLPVELMQAQIDRDPDNEEAGGEVLRQLCPSVLKLMAQVSGDCDIWQRELWKFIGLSFTDDVSFEKIAYLIGQRGTGKGTLFEAWQAALGERNVYMSSLSQICGKHEMINYVGKNLIAFDEAEAGHSTDTVEASRRLKTVGAGSPVSVEGKFDDAFSTRLTAKMVMMSNKLVKLKDASSAMARRLLVFPTAIDTMEGREDFGLKKRVIGEARGVMVMGLLHLRMLYRQGRFAQPPAGEVVVEEFKRLSSPAYAFAKDCLVRQKDSACEESLLRELYIAHAMYMGMGKFGQETLFSELQAAVFGISRMVDKDKNRMIKGVRPRLANEDAVPQAATLYNDPMGVGLLAEFEFNFPIGTEKVGYGSSGGDPGDMWHNKKD